MLPCLLSEGWRIAPAIIHVASIVLVFIVVGLSLAGAHGLPGFCSLLRLPCSERGFIHQCGFPGEKRPHVTKSCVEKEDTRVTLFNRMGIRPG